MWCLVVLLDKPCFGLGRILNEAVLGSLGALMFGDCTTCKGGPCSGVDAKCLQCIHDSFICFETSHETENEVQKGETRRNVSKNVLFIHVCKKSLTNKKGLSELTPKRFVKDARSLEKLHYR